MHDGGSANRGQTGLIGLVLLIALTVMGTTAILALGSSAFQDSRLSSQVGSAEHAMTQLDSRMSLVALGAADSQTASVPLQGRSAELRVEEDAGWVNISVRNESDGNVTLNVMNVTMGAVVYENGGTEIAYQGGGVWRMSGGQGSMVSPPEFHYRTDGGRDPTLTLPLVLVDGGGSLGGRVTMRKNGSTVSKYPVTGDADRSNPLDEGEVNITIHSRHYRAWGQFFEDRTGGNVTYQDDRERVMIALEIPDEPRQITRAVSASAADEEMTLSGSGSFPAFVNSYNSSKGNYTESKSWNGTVEVAADVTVGGNGEIHGNVRSGKAITLDGTAELNGTAYWTTGFNPSGSATYDDDEEIDGVESPDSSTNTVKDEVDNLKSNNDNGATSDISGDSLHLNETTTMLTAGDYYIGGDLQMEGDHLILNTSGGDITIGVDGQLQLEKSGGSGSNITVKGGNTVELYVVDDIQMKKATSVHVPGHESERMWIYGTGESGITVEGSQSDESNVTGVFYAPRGSNEDGDTTVKHGNVFGAVVAGSVEIETGGAVHYDQALQDDEAFSSGSGSGTPEITFLHVSVNRMNVTAT